MRELLMLLTNEGIRLITALIIGLLIATVVSLASGMFMSVMFDWDYFETWSLAMMITFTVIGIRWLWDVLEKL